eukprot:5091274-Amphidinium_carterae.2
MIFNRSSSTPLSRPQASPCQNMANVPCASHALWAVVAVLNCKLLRSEPVACAFACFAFEP